MWVSSLGKKPWLKCFVGNVKLLLVSVLFSNWSPVLLVNTWLFWGLSFFRNVRYLLCPLCFLTHTSWHLAGLSLVVDCLHSYFGGQGMSYLLIALQILLMGVWLCNLVTLFSCGDLENLNSMLPILFLFSQNSLIPFRTVGLIYHSPSFLQVGINQQKGNVN